MHKSDRYLENASPTSDGVGRLQVRAEDVVEFPGTLASQPAPRCKAIVRLLLLGTLLDDDDDDAGVDCMPRTFGELMRNAATHLEKLTMVKHVDTPPLDCLIE